MEKYINKNIIILIVNLLIKYLRILNLILNIILIIMILMLIILIQSDGFKEEKEHVKEEITNVIYPWRPLKCQI